MTKVATIAADVDKQRVLCRISAAVLVKKFRASKDEPMQAVTEYRHQIEAAARILIENRDFEEDGSVTINYKDL